MNLFEPSLPLAERLRPTRLDEVCGQQHLLGPGKPIRRMLEGNTLTSMVLWGPPGVGKTSLARLFAGVTRTHFVQLSAVLAGIKDIRSTVDIAEHHRFEGKKTLLFLDEIHRFNTTQQDALLPHIESGLLTLVGATTENPYVEVNSALRSRARVWVLKPLSNEDISGVIDRALTNPRGLPGVTLTEEGRKHLVQGSCGDARRALNTLEVAADMGASITAQMVEDAFGHLSIGFSRLDTSHFTSALQKSIRASHPDAALYWLAKMVAGGVDLDYVIRRLMRIAAEDVGLADPNALKLAVSTQQALRFLGSPEGDLVLANLAIYLALAPKSNRMAVAWNRALTEAQKDRGVPLHLTQTSQVSESEKPLHGYVYYFDDPEASFNQSYLPEELLDLTLYEPSREGWEIRVRDRWQYLKERHKKT